MTQSILSRHEIDLINCMLGAVRTVLSEELADIRWRLENLEHTERQKAYETLTDRLVSAVAAQKLGAAK